jgi:lipoate-protein ligase A
VEGRKVVGISQRRDRSGARFQCTALLAWPTDVLVDLLRLTPADEALRDLEAMAAPAGVDSDDLVSSLLSHLP